MVKTVISAMSGGVDSSTTAYKLKEEGYRVIGVTLKMGRRSDQLAIDDAKKVADYIGIEHRVVDVSVAFKNSVTSYFINSYINGFTPNPCAMCNRLIKFKELIELKQEIGADYIATGHYARILYNNDIYELHKAKCLERDQSYFLSTLKYEYIQYIKFPLGNEVSKNEVREYAKKIGLHVAEKNDSQDICFLEGGDYKDFLLKNSSYTSKPGLIKHINGEILGEHNGIINYTVGQRKGLGVAYNKPIYVASIDVENNVVYAGFEEDLYSDKLIISNLNILAKIDENKDYNIKLRSVYEGENGRVKLYGGKNEYAEIFFPNKTRAVTKGQLCCIYDGTKVVASGWIGEK
jgi:tRNA-specific 2-thiouridylase